MLSWHKILLATKDQQKIESLHQLDLSISKSHIINHREELVKCGKEYPQIYATKSQREWILYSAVAVSPCAVIVQSVPGFQMKYGALFCRGSKTAQSDLVFQIKYGTLSCRGCR